MAKNYIPLSLTGLRHASSLLSATCMLSQWKDTLELLKADMDQMIDGTDYTLLEATFGVPTGKGQTVYNLVAGAVSELGAASNLGLLIAYLGATR